MHVPDDEPLQALGEVLPEDGQAVLLTREEDLPDPLGVHDVRHRFGDGGEVLVAVRLDVPSISRLCELRPAASPVPAGHRRVLQSHFLPWPAIDSGQFGVDIFFCLSGLLMSNLLFVKRVPLYRKPGPPARFVTR